MSNEVKKGQLFIKEIVARIKGDDADVKAVKIARKAISAVEGQLAALKAREVDLENSVEEGKELLANAMYPTEMITDNQNYIKNIQNAQEALDKDEENLKDVKDSITYFTNLLEKF